MTKRVIILNQKAKRKLTRPQIILRNLLIIVLMAAAVTEARSGTFTEAQAYEKQLNALGITEYAIAKGDVQIVENRIIGEWNWSDMGFYFDPVREVILETRAGGERVHLKITIGRRSLFWYETECEITYPDSEPPDPPTPGYTYTLVN